MSEALRNVTLAAIIAISVLIYKMATDHPVSVVEGIVNVAVLKGCVKFTEQPIAYRLTKSNNSSNESTIKPGAQ